ncbi:MAG: NAD(P)-dependent oxidoreductase [Promethearchaeota archaeon]
MKIKVGFIGTGLMGEPMASNVMKQFSLNVFNRTKEKAQELINAGATWADNPKAVTNLSDAVILMVTDDQACLDIFSDPNGILATTNKDAVIINMSTISPNISIKLANQADQHNLRYLEAPVLGSTGPAQQGTLKILVGGEESLYKKYLPILQTMGDGIHFIGEVGKATVLKLLINANLATQIAILSETLAIGQQNGLDQKAILDVINNSAVGTVVSKIKGPNMISRKYPTAFPYEHMLKDLSYASRLSDSSKLALITATKKVYEKGLNLDLKGADFSAVIEYYLHAE